MGSNQVAPPQGFVLDGAAVEPPPGFVLDQAPNQAPIAQPKRGYMSEIGRQAGLTARYGMEGLGQAADIVGAPLAAGMNYVGGTNRFKAPGAAMSGLANTIGLPSPETPTERVASDASRMLVGTGAMAGGARVLTQGAQGVGRAVAQSMSANSGAQAASAIGSGLAGGSVRESGGGGGAQLAAAVVGGLAAGGLASAESRFGRQSATLPGAAEAALADALKQSKINPSELPHQVMESIRHDVAEAAKIGELSKDSIRRLVDYRLLEATPGRANLTLNPVDITRQKNLEKIGSNSNDTALQGLAMREHDNTGKLIGSLNSLGANTADDAFSGGQKVLKGLNNLQEKKLAAINAAYEAARGQPGLDAVINPYAFTSRANDLLGPLDNGFVPAQVQGWMNGVAKGEIPLTVAVAEQIKTKIGQIQRSSADGNVRRALGYVRQALDDAPMLDSAHVSTVDGAQRLIGGPAPKSAIDAFNIARKLNREWRGMVEKTPALQALEDGVQPDKFVNDYIIRNAKDSSIDAVARLKNSIKGTPEAVSAVREQIIAHLKDKALNGKADEAMRFTEAGYNRALNAIGDRKLRMFMSREDLNQLRAIGRVALYEKVQPDGSAVNNSNTASAAVVRIFEGLANSPIPGKIPFGQQIIGDPAKSISNGIQARKAGDVPAALVRGVQKQKTPYPITPLLMVPGLTAEEESK